MPGVLLHHHNPVHCIEYVLCHHEYPTIDQKHALKAEQVGVVKHMDFTHVHLAMALRVVALFARMHIGPCKMVDWHPYQPD